MRTSPVSGLLNLYRLPYLFTYFWQSSNRTHRFSTSSRPNALSSAENRMPGSRQTIVETVQQMGDRLLGFVPHVGEAKRLAFQFPVAAVDHKMMFFAQTA